MQLPTTAQVFVSSDLYTAGVRCDGHPFHAETFYVVIEFADGARLRHERNFKGCNVVRDDETGETRFRNIRDEASNRAEALAARVMAAGTIDPARWFEIDPAYGSEAYQREGTEAQRVFKEKHGLPY